MVKNVTEPGEQLQPHSLHHADVLEDRGIPRKRVSIANEKNLSETTRRSVRRDKRRICSAIGTDQARINRQKLRRSCACSTETGQSNALRMEQSLDLFQGHSRSELHTAGIRNDTSARVVAVIDRGESTG